MFLSFFSKLLYANDTSPLAYCYSYCLGFILMGRTCSSSFGAI